MGILMLNGNNYTGGVQQVYGTSSGAIASFADGGNNKPLNSLKVAITPQQASGTPSPSNPLPISGWTGANITRCGKNMWNNEKAVADSNVPTVYVDENGWLTFNTSASFLRYNDLIFDGQITLSGTFKSSTDAQNNIRFRAYYSDGTYNDLLSLSTTDTNEHYAYGTSTVNKKVVRIRTIDTSGKQTKCKLQLEIGTIATDYTPYSATTYPITWSDAGTVYGGEIDVLNGKLINKRMILTYDGTENWRLSNNDYFYLSKPKDQIPYARISTVKCNTNILQFVGTSTVNGNLTRQTDYSLGLYIGSVNASEIYIHLTDGATLSDFTSILTTTPLQICVELATPIEYDITPTQINTLLGNNNIWSDTGDITECVYQRDINLAINELFSLLQNQSSTRSLSALNLTKSVSTELKEETTEETKEEEQNEDKR